MDIDKVLFLAVSDETLRKEIHTLTKAIGGDSISFSPLVLGMDALAVNFPSSKARKDFLKEFLPIIHLRNLQVEPMEGPKPSAGYHIW